MTEGSKQGFSMSEYEGRSKRYSEIERRTRLKLLKEFDRKLTELNDRIVSYLSEHGSDTSEELGRFNVEGRELERQFFHAVDIAGNDFNKQFKGLGLREFELSWLDLIWYRNDQREKRHRHETKVISDIIKTKPPTVELRALIKKDKAEVLPWKQLENDIGEKLGKDFVGSSLWDAIKDKIGDVEAGNGLRLLERTLEESKDERQEYTITDLDLAKEDMARANEIGMSGNNPNAGRARQQTARDRRTPRKEVSNTICSS
ncbi:MAG: hypothetical protein Q8L52_02900 [bacterium]|nr:hypothetical protein [bacterium]